MTPRLLPHHALAALLLSLPGLASAQLSIGSSADRLVFGGSVGASFGNVSYVQISPYVGYRVTDEFTAGMGLQYRYRSDDRFGRDLTTQDIGTSVFGRYQLPGPLFVQAELEYLSYQYYRANLTKARDGVWSLLAGGGLSQPLGANASAYALVMYNFSYNGYSQPAPYTSPWVVRFGVGVRF
ncbi:MAG: hypothetical protein U1F52_07450 [Burkholderiales bacterium]